MTFALMRLEDLKKSFYHKKPIKNEAYFYFQDLKIQDTGHYLCFYYDGSYRGSLLSDILKIWVTGKIWVCYGTGCKASSDSLSPLVLSPPARSSGGGQEQNLCTILRDL